MRLQPRTARIAAMLAAALLVVTVAFAAVMFTLIRDASERRPEITAYAHGRTVTVEPLQYCSIDLSDCTTGTEPANLDVPAGSPLQLSLPDAIADAPWHLVTVYQRPDGSLTAEDRYFQKGDSTAVTIVSAENPPLQLNGVEIQLPSAVVDQDGLPIARAVWSIKTA